VGFCNKPTFINPENLFLGLDRICPIPPAKIARMKTANQCMQTIRIQVPGDYQFSLPIHQVPQPLPGNPLPINDGLQIRAAEYWLRLGEAVEALRELEKLPGTTWESPAAVKIRVAALGMLRPRNETTY